MKDELLFIKERPIDATMVDALMDESFGPDRRSLTVYKLRSHRPPLVDLSYIALGSNGVVQGSIRFWPVRIENSALKAIILGPLAVSPDQQGQGVGKALIGYGLEEASVQGYELCLVVGDQRLYSGFGFTNATVMGLRLPGWVEPSRFQLKELKKSCLLPNFPGGEVQPYHDDS